LSKQWHNTINAELMFDSQSQRFSGMGFTVIQKYTLWSPACALHPLHKLIGVGMRRKTVNVVNLRFDRQILAKHANRAFACDQARTTRASRLKSGKHNRIAMIANEGA